MVATTETAVKGVGETPLEDVMVAMDVVDTVRHRQILVDRELDSGARRQRLRERLRDLYAAQGIEVTDDALDAGIAALEEERFRYEPADTGLSTKLARLYVTRRHWSRKIRIPAIFAAVVFGIWLFDDFLPNRRLRTEIPETLATAYSALLADTQDPDAIALANALNADALAAIEDGDFREAEDFTDRLGALGSRVNAQYDVRIVTRPDELSGVWRVPSVNEAARNYYLIVEAVDASGRILSVPILSEESGRETPVTRWGIRVSEQTFEAVAADKRDDGIVQANIVGAKMTGQLRPEYDIPTLGGYITTW